jgi:hypothetical protein
LTIQTIFVAQKRNKRTKVEPPVGKGNQVRNESLYDGEKHPSRTTACASFTGLGRACSSEDEIESTQSIEGGEEDAFVSDKYISIKGVSSQQELLACLRGDETFEKLHLNALDI